MRGSIPSTRRRAPPSRRSWRSRGSWSRSRSSRRSEMGRFTGTVAVVTGAGGGIGRAAAARLATEGASLVLVDRVAGTLKDTQAAVAGLRASPPLGPYSASKHAVIGLTRTAAVELARRGIRVNAVCPAPIDTPMVRQFEAGLGEGAHERLLARIPMQRFGEADEVAALVVFLLSADASYVNGGIYTVDGGSMA